MKTKILSANELEEYIDKHEDSKCAVVCFSSVNAVNQLTSIPIIVSDITVLNFDEIEDYNGYFPEADRLADFIVRTDRETEIICVDGYNQNVSSACAAAIEEYFNNNAVNIFSDYRFCPNQVIYNKLLNAMYRVGHKERDNRYQYIFAQKYDDAVFRLIDLFGRNSKELSEFLDFAEKIASDGYDKNNVLAARIIENRKIYTEQ